MDLRTLATKYNTEKKCYEYLEKIRYKGKPTCPNCGSSKVYKRNDLRFICNDCNSAFSVLHNTIFEDSRLNLTKWFQIITLMTNAKSGISASELERDINVTYKTAWYSAMRVRCAMIDSCQSLQNIVEMDEAYIGGKPRAGARLYLLPHCNTD